MTLILRKPWTKQPQTEGGAKPGVGGLWFGSTWADRVSGRAISGSQIGQRVTTASGHRAISVTGTAALGRAVLNNNGSDRIGDRDFTVMIRFVLQSTAGYAGIGRWNTGATPANCDWSLGGNQWATEQIFSVAVGSTAYTATTGAAGTSVGSEYTMVGRRRGTTIEVIRYNMVGGRISGSAVTGSTTNAGITTVNYNSARSLKLGEIDLGATYNSVFDCIAAAIENRAWTNAEIREYAEAPWLLAAPRHTIIPASARADGGWGERPWTAQPDKTINPNRSSVYFNRLEFAAPLKPDTLENIVDGRKLTASASPQIAYANNGQYYSFGSGRYIDLPKVPQLGITQPCTIAWTDTAISTSGASTILEVNYGSSTESFLIHKSASNSDYYFTVGPRGNNAVHFNTLGAVADGGVNRYVLQIKANVLSVTGSDYVLWLNETSYTGTTGSAANTFTSNTAAVARIGALADGTDPWEGAIGNVHMWSRLLTDAEARAWTSVNGEFLAYEPERVWTPQTSTVSSASYTDGPYVIGTRGLPIDRNTWTRQPQGEVDVDWSNPLAAKARAIALPIPAGARTWARGAAEQLTYANGSGVNSAPSVAGIGIGSTAASTNAHRLHSTGNATTTAWESPTSAATWAAVLVRFGNNANGNAPIFGQDDASVAPFSAWGLMDGSGSGIARFSCSAGGTYRSLDVSGWLDNNVVHTFVGRYDGAELAGFRSGIKHSSTTACSGTLTYPNSANRGPAIGNFWNFAGSSRSFNGRVFLAALWDVALTDSEIAQFSANPWQLFTPRRTLFPVSAGFPLSKSRPFIKTTRKSEIKAEVPGSDWQVLFDFTKSNKNLLNGDSMVLNESPSAGPRGTKFDHTTYGLANAITPNVVDKLTAVMIMEPFNGSQRNLDFLFGEVTNNSSFNWGFYGGNYPGFYVHNGTSSGLVSGSSFTTWYNKLRPQIWVATFDGSQIKLYINGVLDSTAFLSGSIQRVAGSKLGFQRSNSASAGVIDCYLYATAASNRCFTQEEIMQHFSSVDFAYKRLFSGKRMMLPNVTETLMTPPKLSGLTASDITGSTATPRLRVDY